MSSHVKITAILTAHSGKASDLGHLLAGMAPHCRAEAGNLRWDVWEDQDHQGRYVLDELYLDESAVAAHRSTPHYQDYLKRVPSLAERLAFVSRPRFVAPSK